MLEPDHFRIRKVEKDGNDHVEYSVGITLVAVNKVAKKELDVVTDPHLRKSLDEDIYNDTFKAVWESIYNPLHERLSLVAGLLYAIKPTDEDTKRLVLEVLQKVHEIARDFQPKKITEKTDNIIIP